MFPIPSTPCRAPITWGAWFSKAQSTPWPPLAYHTTITGKRVLVEQGLTQAELGAVEAMLRVMYLHQLDEDTAHVRPFMGILFSYATLFGEA